MSGGTIRKKPAGLTVDPTPAPPSTSDFVETSDRVTLSLPESNSEVTILLYGATVISWKINGNELLFLSDGSSLDGSRPVRGGIPLVFPVFGPPEAGSHVEGLPQHGFARNHKWELLGRTEEALDSARVDFGLSAEALDEDSKKIWPHNFALIYSVTLGASTLGTKLVVQNAGETPFDFNVLFHTYLRIPNVDDVGVKGLNSLTYRDKLQNHAEITESNEIIPITGTVDRVYKSVPGSVEVLNKGEPLFTITKDGLEDVVLWNPYSATDKIADFEPKDGYKNMVCVEAGSVAAWQTLEGNAAWEGGVLHKAHL